MKAIEKYATEIQEQCMCGASISDVMQLLREFSEQQNKELKLKVKKYETAYVIFKST